MKNDYFIEIDYNDWEPLLIDDMVDISDRSIRYIISNSGGELKDNVENSGDWKIIYFLNDNEESKNKKKELRYITSFDFNVVELRDEWYLIGTSDSKFYKCDQLHGVLEFIRFFKPEC